MKPRDLTDLLLLAAIWGASFLFMRLAVPAFGPVALAFVRVAGAALFLLPLLLLAPGEAQVLRRRWPALLVLGLTNSALPFLLFGYALYTLPAGLAAIFNAATPLCTALIAWAWLGDPLNRWRSLGLALGFAGVAGLALMKSLSAPDGSSLAGLQFDRPTALAIGACLLGTLLYGYAGNHAKHHLHGVPALAMAAGTQAAAALALALPAALTWPANPPGLRDWLAAAGLAVLASGLAYILYFRLISRVGPTRASSVTFLVPMFAALWGGLFLGEQPTLPMLLGGAVILAGTALVLGLLPRPPGRAGGRTTAST